MSRTPKDSKVHGPLAYGKGTKQRAYGFEWSNRRVDGKGWSEPGKFTKRETHRYERRKAKKQISDADE